MLKTLLQFFIFSSISTIIFASELKTAKLQWLPHPKAIRYELQISDDLKFKKIVFWKTTNQSNLDVEMPPGSYFFRVRAIEKNGAKGSWSNQQQFTIAEESADSDRQYSYRSRRESSDLTRNFTVFLRVGQALGYHMVDDVDLGLNSSEDGAGFDGGVQLRYFKDLNKDRKLLVDFHSLWRRQISNGSVDWLNRTRVSGAYLFSIGKGFFIGPRGRFGIKNSVLSFSGADPSNNIVVYREKFSRTELRIGAMAAYVPNNTHTFLSYFDGGLDSGGAGSLGFPRSFIGVSSRFGWNFGLEYFRNLGTEFQIGAEITVSGESYSWDSVSSSTSTFSSTWANFGIKFGYRF